MNKSLTLDSETSHIILDNALDAHILMDREGTIVGWNPQSERIFGWSADEVLGRRLSDLSSRPHTETPMSGGFRPSWQLGKAQCSAPALKLKAGTGINGNSP